MVFKGYCGIFSSTKNIFKPPNLYLIGFKESDGK